MYLLIKQAIQPSNKNAQGEGYVAVRDKAMLAFLGCAKNSNIETELKHTTKLASRWTPISALWKLKVINSQLLLVIAMRINQKGYKN